MHRPAWTAGRMVFTHANRRNVHPLSVGRGCSEGRGKVARGFYLEFVGENNGGFGIGEVVGSDAFVVGRSYLVHTIP